MRREQQTVLLTGSATQIFVANTLTSSTATANFGDAVTFTDTIPLIDGIVATGTVSFYNGSALLGTVAVPSSGIVPFTDFGPAAGSGQCRRSLFRRCDLLQGDFKHGYGDGEVLGRTGQF